MHKCQAFPSTILRKYQPITTDSDRFYSPKTSFFRKKKLFIVAYRLNLMLYLLNN